MAIARPDNQLLPGHFLDLEASCYTDVKAESIHVSRSTQGHSSTETNIPCDNDLTSLSIKLDRGNLFSVREDGGILLVWGCGEFGQHGHGHQNNVLVSTGSTNPLLIGQDDLVTSVACGSSHTICITEDNRIFSWGNSNSGQLGIGDTKTTLQPHLVQLGITPGTRIKGVTCGTRHTFIWSEEGECFSFGNNFSAQLGYDFRKPDFKENQLSPIYLERLFNHKVVQVACGSRHSLFLFSTGVIASVGANDRGQLGLDSKIDNACVQNVPDINGVCGIACGNCHSIAVDGDGIVYVWGYGKACGSKDDILCPSCVYQSDNASIVRVAGGDSHSAILLDTGQLLSWGSNFEGQLGQGVSIKFQSKPVPISSQVLQKVVSISIGENTSAAITEGGRLFMWGRNVSQVIKEDEGPRYCQYDPYPVPLGNWHAIAVSCGSWHVACIVSPGVRPNTWEWTPLAVANPTDEPIGLECNNIGDDAQIDAVRKGELSQSEDDFKAGVVNKSINVIEEKDIAAVKCDMKIGTPKSEMNNESNPNTDGCLVVQALITTCSNNQDHQKQQLDLHLEAKQMTSTQPENDLAQKPNLRRSASEDTPIWKQIGDIEPVRQFDPQLFSRSLCNVKSEKSVQDLGEENERRSSTGTIRSTSQTRSCQNRSSSEPKVDSSELSRHEPHVSVSSTSAGHRTNVGNVSPSRPGTSSRISHIPHTPVTNQRLKTSGRTVCQLQREKKTPRHLRKVPSGTSSEYCLPNQPIPSCDVEHIQHKETVHGESLQRTQSNPNIHIYNYKPDITQMSLRTPTTPPSNVQLPHPPLSSTRGLPPRPPRSRKLHTQSLAFSSGSSWRKRK